ncbi:MAG: hypothetical protein WBF06_15460 [Candidatus Acidiferrales bacterium]
MNITQAPGTTELGGPPPEEIQKELTRLIHSKAFRHSAALQRLLQYLIGRAIEDPFGDVKEYTIGTEVFDRGPGYDPQTDTIVRVQIHRLRLKVKEYYESEGINDPIFVDIPKGHYIPTFESRSVAVPKASQTNVSAETITTPIGGLDAGPKEATRPAFFTRGVFLIPVIMLIFASGIILGTRWEQSRVLATSDAISNRAASAGLGTSDAAASFWKSFLGSDSAPVLGYADAVYLVDGAQDLFRFRRGASDNQGTLVEPHLAEEFASSPSLVKQAGPLYYEDGNTGTGDLESVFVLTRLFTQMGVQMTVKRCRLMTIDDLKQHDVILLGSPEENDAVAQLPQVADFVWTRLNVPGPWKGEFVNSHPQPGERLTYQTERDPNTQEVTADYGLITLEPGALPGRYIAILGGLDTSGVAGSAQFLTSPSHMSELEARLKSLSGWAGDGPPPSFQALLRVAVEKGHDVLGVQLITVHLTTPDKNSVGTTPNSGTK